MRVLYFQSVSFTTGAGPGGYTTLNPANLEAAIASADSSNLLPYLVGSAPVLAYAYPDQVLAYTHVSVGWLLGVLFFILIMGYAASFFVPRLPMGLPRRDFGVISCLTLDGSGELPSPIKTPTWAKNTDLEDLRRRVGNVKVRYGV